MILKSFSIDTPLGPMIAIASEEALYLLEFDESKGLEREMKRLEMKATIIPGTTDPILSIKRELKRYFDGGLTEFKTEIVLLGSDFQKSVWEKLQQIPFGNTRSYSHLACDLGKPSACRAVAKANSTNQLALIVPCHRVINADGGLGGYASGIMRKKWLIDHERRVAGK